MPDFTGNILNDYKNAIKRAVLNFYQQEPELLEINVNERTITNRISRYLERETSFEGFNVDCEYNRHGIDVKSVELFLNDDSNETRTGRIYPDIIIHKRGLDSSNIVVIEAKREGEDIGNDQLKLAAIKNKFNYKLALLLIIPKNQNDHFRIMWLINDGNFLTEVLQ